MPERAGEQAPALIRELAAQRLAARQARDYAAADRLRAEIAQQGWVVTDTPGGYDLAPAAPAAAYEVLADPGSQSRCGRERQPERHDRPAGRGLAR